MKKSTDSNVLNDEESIGPNVDEFLTIEEQATEYRRLVLENQALKVRLRSLRSQTQLIEPSKKEVDQPTPIDRTISEPVAVFVKTVKDAVARIMAMLNEQSEHGSNGMYNSGRDVSSFLLRLTLEVGRVQNEIDLASSVFSRDFNYYLQRMQNLDEENRDLNDAFTAKGQKLLDTQKMLGEEQKKTAELTSQVALLEKKLSEEEHVKIDIESHQRGMEVARMIIEGEARKLDVVTKEREHLKKQLELVKWECQKLQVKAVSAEGEVIKKNAELVDLKATNNFLLVELEKLQAVGPAVERDNPNSDKQSLTPSVMKICQLEAELKKVIEERDQIIQKITLSLRQETIQETIRADALEDQNAEKQKTIDQLRKDLEDAQDIILALQSISTEQDAKIAGYIREGMEVYRTLVPGVSGVEVAPKQPYLFGK